jgi:hypothetical protein
LYPVNDLLETKSHLFVLLKNGFPTLLARFGLTALFFPQVFERNQLDSTCWQITTDICSDIRATFAEQGKPVLFVLLPAPYQVYEEDFYRHLEMFDVAEDSVDILQPNRILAETFAADSLYLTDPLEYLQKRAKKGEILFGSVDSHFNVLGHRVMTDYLFPIVETYLKPQLED